MTNQSNAAPIDLDRMEEFIASELEYAHYLRVKPLLAEIGKLRTRDAAATDLLRGWSVYRGSRELIAQTRTFLGDAPSSEPNEQPMSGFMSDERSGIVPDPNYKTRFKVGERILPDSHLYRWRPTATVTEITHRGFKYRYDEKIVLGPRHGWYQEGESFTDDGWDLAADQSPSLRTNE